MANSLVLAITIICFLVLTTGGSAFRQRPQLPHQEGQQQAQYCRIQSLNPLEPARRIQHEAGYTDVWDQTSNQIQCAGVAASRHLIQQGGLLLPSFNNAPLLAYVVQGRGIVGTINPGCAETFQSSKQTEAGERFGFGSERFRDQHQKIHPCRKGDIVAFQAGVAHWVHNDGNEELELMVVHDTSNADNQLDQNLRRFFLAGNPQESEKQQTKYGGQQEEMFSGNLFQGFETEVLAESFKIDLETAARLQGQDDNRGFIIRVGKEFKMQRPSRYEEEIRERSTRNNGFEETICTMRIRENLDDPERADVYTAQGGRISTVNSHNLPILKQIQLSAERGVLYENAMAAPHWTLNAHNIIYILRGSGRIQVVGHSNRAVFNGEVRQGQLLVVPQNYAEVKQAGNEGLEWVSFKTNDRAVSSPLAGKTSVMRAMPEEVVMSAFRVSREEAHKLKYNRQEVRIFPQSSSKREKGSRWSIV